MGYNVSKSKRIPSKTYRYEQFQNPRSIKVVHDSQYKRKKSSRRQKHQRNPLQQEYDAWLRSLSLDPEYHEYGSPKTVWKRNRDSWHKTIQKKVSSLMKSKKHRQEVMVWPQQSVDDTKKNRKKKQINPPTVRLAFADEKQRMEEIRKQLNHSVRENHGKASHKQSVRRKKIHPDKRSSLDVGEGSLQSSLLSHHNSVSNHSSNSDLRRIGRQKYKKKINGSNLSLYEIQRSRSRSSNLDNAYGSSSNERSLHHSRNSHESLFAHLHDKKYRWDVPIDYNAIQGGASIMGPRVLPYKPPGMEPCFSVSETSDQNVSKKPSPIYQDLEEFYGMSGFQIAGNDVTNGNVSTSSRPTSPKFTTSNDPKLHCIIAEVGENFKSQFSNVSNHESWGTSQQNCYSNPCSSRDSVLDANKIKNLTPNDLFNKTPPPELHLKEHNLSVTNTANDDRKVCSNDNQTKEEWRKMTFGPGGENFFLARTNELCTKTITDELHRLGFNNINPHVNIPSTSNKSEPVYGIRAPPSETTVPSGFLWRKKDPMISSLSSFHHYPSPYKCDKEVNESMSDSDIPNYSSAEYRDSREVAPFLAKKRMRHRFTSEPKSGYASDATSVDSQTDYTDSRENIFESESNLQRSSIGHRPRRKKQHAFTKSAANFSDVNNTLELEAKIDHMVKSMIGEKLGIPKNKPPLTRMKKRRKQGRKAEKKLLSARDIQAIIEDQLAAALTSAMVPNKDLNQQRL